MWSEGKEWVAQGRRMWKGKGTATDGRRKRRDRKDSLREMKYLTETTGRRRERLSAWRRRRKK